MSSTSCKAHSERWIVNAVEKFADWDKKFYLWKSFHVHQRNLVRAYIGLAFFGNPKTEDSELENLWFKYPKSERDLITELEDKFKYENNQIVIGHTYLYLDSDEITCVLRQLKSDNQVIFIDCMTRVYQSWNHFRENNQLPSCKFVAPNDGSHKIVGQQLLIYQSPAASVKNKILKTTDVLTAGSGLVAAGLVVASTAPVSALILGSISVVYNVGRSIGVLADRKNHNQSIGLDNLESIISWLNVASSVVGITSTAAMSSSRAIVQLSGESASVAIAVLKGINYAALTVSCTNFGTYVYSLVDKIQKKEELTALDCLVGCINIFLIAGAVANTRQMNKFINSLKKTPTTTAERLTSNVKRELQKLYGSGDTVTASGKANVKEVTTFEENFPAFGMQFLYNMGQQFLAKHSYIQHIYYKCLEIWHTCLNFRCHKIGAVVFVSNMINHVQNLYILVTDALVKIKSKVEMFLKPYFRGQFPNSLSQQIGHMVENTTSAVTNVNEILLEEPSLEDEKKHDKNKSKLLYEIIFEVAKNRIPRTTPSNEIISVFNEQLSILIEEITNELKENYEEWISKNIEMMGKDKANETFANLGMKTLNDFANLNFAQAMESKIDEVKMNHIIANEEMIQTVWAFYKKILSKATPRSTLAELGAIETCQLLRQSLTEILNPLDKTFKSAKELYETNASFVGHVTAMSLVFNTLNLKSKTPYSSDNSTFIDLAAETFDVDRIARELSLAIRYENRTEKKISHQLSDENVQFTVLSLCDKFFRQVESKLVTSSNADRENRVKDCYHYFMEKFTFFVRNTKRGQTTEILECLKLGSRFHNQSTFISSYENACQILQYKSFAYAVELFTQEKNIEALAQEYVTAHKVANNFYVEVCNEINKEDGMRMFSINEGGYLNLRAYKSNAAKLFDLDENQMELIKWEKGAVILKCGFNRNVIFQTVDTKSMIAMEIDTSKKLGSE